MRCATDFVLTGGLWAVVAEKHCSNINDVRYYFFAVCVKRTPAFFAIDPLDSSRQSNARRSRPTLRVQKCHGRVQQYIVDTCVWRWRPSETEKNGFQCVWRDTKTIQIRQLNTLYSNNIFATIVPSSLARKCVCGACVRERVRSINTRHVLIIRAAGCDSARCLYSSNVGVVCTLITTLIFSLLQSNKIYNNSNSKNQADLTCDFYTVFII